MSKDLATAYQPAEIERRWYSSWEDQGLFCARADSDRNPFVIVLPPPNVTGSLHIGHAFEHTLQDAFIRRARMLGFETLWLPGTDHAGIATQNVVERELRKEGLRRDDLGREAFVERVWEWKAKYGGRITEQMRRLGDSCDWTRERFTMDEGLSRAVRTVFVRWFEDGLIYRGLRIINWCPRCGTALSDIEVEHEDVGGELVTFRYELADGSGSISVATTRVETMLGDTGVFVHPDDERYRALVGKKVRHPFFSERDMPIAADKGVDPEFGTGAVKATPAHDPLDFEMGERQGLEKINVLDGTAHINENGGRFAGLDRYEARATVLAELQKLGLVEKIERPYVHAVGHCYRCHTEVEPWLSEQWFVKMKPLAEPAAAAVRDGRIRMAPERFKKSYLDWMDNIRDWCISRQIWWGHRIPVWYCGDCGATFASLEEPAECRKCSSKSITQDPDVLDTWFSSQLWPFSTLGWPEETADLKYFYPTTLMTPGYEILYLWVARMIASGLYFVGDVPFKEVYVHGIVRDFEGKKMSKSLGNVIDPLDMIELYGADALRFSLASGAVPGSDTNVSEDRIEGARNFANKLWNAARYVLLTIGDDPPASSESLGLADRWILSRLDDTIGEIEGQLAGYNWAEALKALYRFVWSEYCDWYIELSKLTPGEPGTRWALVEVLDAVLRLLHPVMPFITEELWSKLRQQEASIMVAAWPQGQGREDPSAEAVMERFQDLVGALRRLKVDHGIPQVQRIPVTMAAGPWRGELEGLRDALVVLARLEAVDFVDELGSADGVARAITPAGIEVEVALGEVIDIEVERRRLQSKIAELDEDMARAARKLDDEQFLTKAPESIIDKERAKLEDARAAKSKLQDRLQSLGV
ncbi:MAG: valine--tRNA ligase [Actinomycetota bacterium]